MDKQYRLAVELDDEKDYIKNKKGEQMKDLCIRESYQKNGKDVVSWNKIGILFEKGEKQYIKLNHIPNTLISVFEQKKKENGE